MDKRKNDVIISDWYKGIADYDYEGFVRVIGYTPFNPKGALNTTDDLDIDGYSRTFLQLSAQWQAGWGTPVCPISDGVTNGYVYAEKVQTILGMNTGVVTLSTPPFPIIDCIIYGGKLLYVTPYGVYVQPFGGSATLILNQLFSGDSRIYQDTVANVFIVSGNGTKISWIQGNFNFDETDPDTYVALGDMLILYPVQEKVTSLASNGSWVIMGTEKGNIISYQMATNGNPFVISNISHISDNPIDIAFEVGSNFYVIDRNFAFYQVYPSQTNQYQIIRQGLTSSRKIQKNPFSLARGYITEKFYIFWYNSLGNDYDNGSGTYYDSGILPSGLYGFTNPQITSAENIGLFCLSGVMPFQNGNYFPAIDRVIRGSEGYLALVRGIVPSVSGSNTYPVLTNNDSTNGTYFVQKYFPSFDTKVCQVGTSQAKDKLVRLSLAFYGNGGKVRIWARKDNNGYPWELMTTNSLGGDFEGFIDFTGKPYGDFNFNYRETTHIQLRVETLDCILTNLTIL